MKVENTGAYPTRIDGERVEPGETVDVDNSVDLQQHRNISKVYSSSKSEEKEEDEEGE